MKGRAHRFGREAETLASAYLESLGYRIVERNVRTPYGELDIVARDGEVVVIVEVKARRSNRYGTPQEALTPLKRARIRDAALAYLQSQNALNLPCRFDVIALTVRGGTPHIAHLRDAFRDEN